jgi:hypothetical protein
MPTPTNTPVLVPGGANGQEAAAGSKQTTPTVQLFPTRTPVAPKGAPAGTTVVPETGFGGFEAVLIAIGLAAVLVIARRLRMSM